MAKRKAETAPKKPIATQWLEKIGRAQKIKEDWRNRFRVSLGYEYFDGVQRPPHVPQDQWITINLVYSTLQSMLPVMYRTDPYYYVRLARSYSPNPMDIAAYDLKAGIRQAMLNYLTHELNLKAKARMSIMDSFFQYGVVKVVHTQDTVENEHAGNEILYEDGTPMLDEMGMPMLEPESLPANEAYKILRIHPDDYLVDEDAGPLDDSVSWCAHRIKMDLEEVRNDKRYRKKARDIVQATESREQYQQDREKAKKGTAFSPGDEDVEPDVVVIYEIYDRKKDEWLVVAQDCPECLITPEPVPPGIEGDPFVDLRYTLRNDSWYPIPPVSQWLDPQQAYCERRSKVLVHNKRFNRKYTLNAGGFEDPERAAQQLADGDDGTVILSHAPGQHIWPVQDAPLDMQVHTEIAYARGDFNELSVGPNQRGNTQGVASATEAGILEVRAQVREGDWVSTTTDFLTMLGRKLDQQVQANITADQAIRVRGPEGEHWHQVRTSDYDEIRGEYTYTINVTNRLPQIPEVERAQWNGFLGILAAAPFLARSFQLLKETAQKFGLENDPMLQELHQMAQQMPLPGQPGAQQTGSVPNVTENDPQTEMGGGYGIANFRGGT